MLLQTHFLIHSHLGVALVAQRPALILDEAQVRQLLVAHLAAEALRVPGAVQRRDALVQDGATAPRAPRATNKRLL